MKDAEMVVTVNARDSKDGFFTVSTTKVADYKRICKLVGGEANLKFTKLKFAGRVYEYIIQVPLEFYCFPVKNKPKPRTEAQIFALDAARQALAESLKEVSDD